MRGKKHKIGPVVGVGAVDGLQILRQRDGEARKGENWIVEVVREGDALARSGGFYYCRVGALGETIETAQNRHHGRIEY